MKKIYFITIPVIIAGIFIDATQLQAQNAVAMVKPASAVKIDGTTAEWGSTLAQYDSKSKLNYSISSDDSMLYVVATSADRLTRAKMMFGGLTVSVNTEGKKKKAFSMTYPSPGSGNFIVPAEDEKPTPPPSGIKISGFKDVDSKVTSIANPYGFKAAGTLNEERTLTYEMAIPTKLLGIKPGTDILVNISVNGFDVAKARAEAAASGPPKNHGGKGGGRGSRDSGGATPAGGDSPEDDMTESMDFWIKTTTAH